MSIKLPISKSIANRILLLQAINGDELMPVAVDMPDDVIVLHDALQQLRDYKHNPSSVTEDPSPLVLNLKNCGTALRFLEVHLDKCYPGAPVTLTGDPRLMERKGKPTSQTTSALILHGEDIPVSPDESPYITMTRKVMERYKSSVFDPQSLIEPDWSAASYWYEYVAIHGGELLLEGLQENSLQGDRIVADIYAAHFGVQTIFTAEGAKIINHQLSVINGKSIMLDFTDFPDLYPAIALTCERLGLSLHATGTDRLRYKESDRLEAVRLHEVRADHRMAMSLMAADYPVSNEDRTCTIKSYPRFVEELNRLRSIAGPSPVHSRGISHITPIKGVNDDHMGKKHALSKLIHAATSDYLWLHDDDVLWPAAAKSPSFNLQSDVIILPLKMESENARPSLLERLQIAEYAAIQELTMRTAKRGRAVMCSGANLIVRRDVWLACEPDLHPDIPSGDDMFLLEAAKRRAYTVGVIDEPDYTAVVRPLTSWRAFFSQRMRWAGKAPRYTDRDILRCGALVTFANLFQLLCPLIILVKFPIEWGLIKKREPRTTWYVALLLEILYPFYLLICLLGGLFRTKEW